MREILPGREGMWEKGTRRKKPAGLKEHGLLGSVGMGVVQSMATTWAEMGDEAA